MKNSILVLLVSCLISTQLFAQVPQKISYQSVIRDQNNVLIRNKSIGIKISIIDSLNVSKSVYAETHKTNSNINGLVTLQIGAGLPVLNTFSTIDWGNGVFYIKVEADPEGGTNYSISGTSQLLSVPYALYAGNSIPGAKGEKGDKGDKGDAALPINGVNNQTLFYKNGAWVSDSLILNNGKNITISGDSLNINTKVKATSYTVPNGKNTEFLKADGSIDTVAYSSLNYLTQNYWSKDSVDAKITKIQQQSTIKGYNNQTLRNENGAWVSDSLILNNGKNLTIAGDSLTIKTKVKASSYAIPNGKNTEFLKADGSIDTVAYSSFKYLTQNYWSKDSVDAKITKIQQKSIIKGYNNQTLRNENGAWVSDSLILNNGKNLTISGDSLSIKTKVKATSYSTPNGKNTQFLKADGSLDTVAYASLKYLTQNYWGKDSVNAKFTKIQQQSIIKGYNNQTLRNENGVWVSDSLILNNGKNITISGDSLTIKTKVKATSYSTPNGKNTQFLKADGSIDTVAYSSFKYLTQNYWSKDSVDAKITKIQQQSIIKGYKNQTLRNENGVWVSDSLILNNGKNITISGDSLSIKTKVKATSYATPNGKNTQFLKADGSIDSSVYLVKDFVVGKYLPIAGGTLTGELNGTFINTSQDVTINGVTVGQGIERNITNLKFGNFKNFNDGYLTIDSSYFKKGINNNVFLGNESANFSIPSTINDNVIVGNQTFNHILGAQRCIAIGNNSFWGGSNINDVITIGYNSSKGATGQENVILGNNNFLGSKGLTPSKNTFIGNNVASECFTSGNISRNVAVGFEALLKGGNADNVAIGFQSLSHLVSIGGNNVSGNLNIGIGSNSLNNLLYGNNNIAIGSYAIVPNSTGSNQLRIGNTDITYAGIQVPWTITSDKRFKNDIQNSNLGLDFVLKLRPVSYLRNGDVNKKREYGFIAQEVDSTLQNANVSESGIISKDNKEMLSIRYNDLIAPLVKAIQEQQVQIEALKKEIELLKNAKK